MRTKYKYLMKNIGLLTLSSFGSKILSFLLIPLYTSVLSTADYGTYDIYSITVSLLMPILTLNIVESVMRFSLDVSNNKKMVFSIGLKRVAFASLFFSIIILFNNYFGIITILANYSLYLVLLFITTLFYELMLKFCRGLEKVGDIAIAGVINSATFFLLNILFLLYFKLGLDGYFLANIISMLIPTFFLIIKEKMWQYFTREKDYKLKKEMISYSSPLVFNTLSWWVNNASDRFIIILYCGASVSGIYSVAYKIPAIINIFQSIFNQAWVLSAIKEFKNGNNEFYAKIYKVYNCTMIIICSLIIILDKIIAKCLFTNDFYIAWKYAPILLISTVFGAMSGYLGGVFSAAKKSKLYAKSTIIGAVINLIINLILIKPYGAYGAAIATLVSYIIVWIIRTKEVNKIIKLNIDIKMDILNYILLIVQAILISIITNNVILYFLELVIFVIIIILNKIIICELILKIKGGLIHARTQSRRI